MRTRMSGRVGGEDGQPSPLSRFGRQIHVIVGGSGSGGLHGYMQLATAENVQHALQIVGGYSQADFRLRSPQSDASC